MSKKQQPKGPSGSVFAVGSGTSESIKEKVQAVRAVVPNRSNTEIVLVLQHFDNAVDRAVHAFVEGNASEVLKEWTVTGKKKNKKKKPKAKAPPGSAPSGRSGEEENWEKLEKLEKLEISLNGFHGNGSGSLESLNEGPEPPAALGNRILGIPEVSGNFSTQSQPPTPARSLQNGPGSPGGKRPGASLEKSLKDLQRCSVALARFRALLREEVENSLRRARLVFGELQSCLMDREVALLAEMDKVKAEAMDLLALRQRRAEALRELTEAAPGMSEEQLQELRADIKHFVSERKFDEELGRAGRFGCDLDALRGSIGAFGQVSRPRTSYSSRSRCSSSPAFPMGSTPGSASGSAPAFPTGSAPGAPGSAAGSAPAFPAGSAPGSPPEFPGSSPGSPKDSTAPMEPPPAPQLPQQSRKLPGAAGPRPSPQRPPGTPKNPKIPKNPPGTPKNPGIPKNAPGTPNPPRRRAGPRRSRPEGTNS